LSYKLQWSLFIPIVTCNLITNFLTTQRQKGLHIPPGRVTSVRSYEVFLLHT